MKSGWSCVDDSIRFFSYHAAPGRGHGAPRGTTYRVIGFWICVAGSSGERRGFGLSFCSFYQFCHISQLCYNYKIFLAVLTMVERLKQHLGKKECREAIKPDMDIVGRIDVSRRGFLKCLGAGMIAATAPGVLTGCEQQKDLPEALTQYFDFHECAPFKEGETKEWGENNEWKIENTGPMLQHNIDSSLDYPIPIDDLFKFDLMEDGGIGVVYESNKYNLEHTLAEKGFDPVSIDYESKDGIFKMTVKGKGNLNFSASVYPSIILIEGTDRKTGLKRILEMPRGDGGYGRKVKEHIYERNKDGDPTEKKVEIVTPGGETGTFDIAEGNYYSKTPASLPLKVDSSVSLDKLLSESDSKGLCMEFFKYQLKAGTKEKLNPNQMTGIKDIKGMEQLIEIFKKLPKEPVAISGFMKFAVHYEKDRCEETDEYRHPLDILRSGWADCDDYTVINHLWAYVHGLNPHVIRVEKSASVPGHVFVWYKNEKGQVVVLNNDINLTLAEGATIEDYIKANKPGYYITFNDHIQ